jgi:hypothetical protein
MKKTEALVGSASDGMATSGANGAETGSGFLADAWNPRQVWLTRIRQPREDATGRLAEATGERETRLPGDEPGAHRGSGPPSRR